MLRKFAFLLPAALLVCGCSRSTSSLPVAESVEEITIKPGERPPPEAAPIEPAASDWPWWRGIHHDGKGSASATELPLEWSTSKNVVWRTPIPGRGHASPIVWQDHVFIATADEKAHTQSLLALSRDGGKILWSNGGPSGRAPLAAREELACLGHAGLRWPVCLYGVFDR